MALTEDEILQQINVLTKKTSDNPEMIYKASTSLNKALDPEHFSGQNTKIVNAINKLAKDFAILETYVNSTSGKNNDIILDVHTDINGPIWAETQVLMGAATIVEGINKILKGGHQHHLLGLGPDDIDKILVVKQDKHGHAVVKAVDSHDEYYHNDKHEDITSVGQAIDILLDHLDVNNNLIIDWEMIQNKPEEKPAANNLVLAEGSLQLIDEETILALVDVTIDSDIDDIISGLN